MNTSTTATAPVATAALSSAFLPLLARLCLAALFVVFGVRKLIAFAATAGYFAKLGLPAPEVMTAIAIALEVGGGVLIAIGWRTRWAALALAAFVAIATLLAHRYWSVDPAQYVAQMTQFFKNLSIVGGLLLLAAYGAGSLSVDGR